MADGVIVLSEDFLQEIKQMADPCYALVESLCSGEKVYSIDFSGKNGYRIMKCMHRSKTGIKYAKTKVKTRVLENCGSEFITGIYEILNQNIAQDEEYLRSQGQNPDTLLRTNRARQSINAQYIK